jgi:hypothetical protein
MEELLIFITPHILETRSDAELEGTGLDESTPELE